MSNVQDTIVALATPPGRGGVGIIRISGPKAQFVAEHVLAKMPKPRYVEYLSFYDEDKQVIDQGLALWFPNPNSFTGEDVLELHGHGGPVVMDCLLKRILQLGARMANPGEFSERAFLNDKCDLAQAEAIADLIDASSVQAAKAAMRSLQGDFSHKITKLVEELIQLRIYVEAAIDFPEEEIDFLSDEKVTASLKAIIEAVTTLKVSAQQGALLREGMTVVIAGAPNAGKSSLLNQLSGRESAIVTDIPGTTRDVLREHIHIDGIPLHVIDTAGLRDSPDQIEQEGIRRAWSEIEKADQILYVVDATEKQFNLDQQFPKEKLTIVYNKIDLLPSSVTPDFSEKAIQLSAKTGEGIDELLQHLKDCVGFKATSEGSFIARRRHLDAIERAYQFILAGQNQLQTQRAGELLAEDLRFAQQSLSEITGEFSSDDLLGRIFSSFCIGK